MIHDKNNPGKRKMKEESKIYPIWIIRWKEPYGIECKSGTREQIEEYAKKKAKKSGNTYIIV